MVNQSKINDKRYWNKWRDSGAVGNLNTQVVYRNLECKGNLVEVFPSTSMSRKETLDRQLGRELVSPEVVDLTRIRIEKENGSEYCGEVFGLVSNSDIGQEVRLLESYSKLRDTGDKVFSQEFYLGGVKQFKRSVIVKD